MAAGLGILRLGPQVFWSMTPRELSAAVDAIPGLARPAQAPSRRDLIRLMQQFPDRPSSDGAPAHG